MNRGLGCIFELVAEETAKKGIRQVQKTCIITEYSFKVSNLKQMNTLKNIVLECDIFAHGSLQRYKEQQSYRTLAGGIVSIFLIIFFSIVFANLVINTFQKTIINSSESKLYYDDPRYGELAIDPSKNYMFAIGLTGIDLSSKQRYFDIVLSNKTYTKNGSNTIKNVQSIPLIPCKIDQWSGISDTINRSYFTQAFDQWLCPPTGANFSLQGKFSSQNFKFAQIIVSKCSNNALFPNTTCKNSNDITNFLAANGEFTFNFYFINPVVNPENPQFITYYLQDSNYFAFDTITGVSANLFYNDFTVKTDATLFPWTEYEEITGLLTTQMAVGQNFQITSTQNQYFRFYLRKAAYQFQYCRSFQKLDQTFSYIGGLFGTIVLLLLFLRIYSKYSYELNVGDKIFKQNNGGSFGSQHFNFVVFMGYLIFNFFSKIGIIFNWKTMKRYHECRVQCQKQLSVDLLMQKLTHFEQISKILMEEHHLKMLMIVPKPTLKQAKLTRKRYLMKSIVYHQLQRKGRDTLVESSEYKRRLHQFLRQTDHKSINQMFQGSNSSHKVENALGSFKGLQLQIASSFKKLQSSQSDQKISISEKIKNRLSVSEIGSVIFDDIVPSFANNHERQVIEDRSSQTYKQLSIEPLIETYKQQKSEQSKVKILEPLTINLRNPSSRRMMEKEQKILLC